MAAGSSIPPGKLRQRQKAETNRLILESARFLFKSEGFEKTTIRSIATKAEIGLGTIYKHFSDKTSIFAVVFCSDIDSVLAMAFEHCPEDSSLEDQLMFIFSRLFHFYAERSELSKSYLRWIAFIEGRGKTIVDQLNHTFFAGLIDLVEKAKIRCEVKEDVDAFLLCTAFFSHYLSVLGFAFFNDESFNPESALNLLRQMIDLLMNGVRPG